jgi:hypothetical protein
MDKYHLHWFTDEVHMHAASALAAFSRVCQLIESDTTRQSREVWSAIQSFLTHAAVVSKILDPIKPDATKRERSEALRGHLGVSEDSALLPRDARDNLEHIDERIDRWAKSGERGVLEMVFEDREGFDYICGRGGAIRRVLILDEMTFVSEGRNGSRVETGLAALAEALREIERVCLHKLETEAPYHYVLAQALLRHAR